MTKNYQVGRLAMRREGAFWRAYYALPDSMEDAILLGSIAMKFIEGDSKAVRRDAFMDFMKQCVADILENQTGERPTWPTPPQAAPEHERRDR